MSGTEFEVPVWEPSEAVAPVLMAFDVFVRRCKRRHQNRERQEFQVTIAEDLFGQEVQRSQHGSEFAAGAASPLIEGMDASPG